MRLLHTADWHLGKVLHEVSLVDDQAHVLEQLVAELAGHDYDALVIAGDIFDRAVPPPEAVSLWDDVLVRLRSACPQLPIVVIPGNHDSGVRLAWASRFLVHEGIYVRTEAGDLASPVTLGQGDSQVDLFAVPWLAGASQRELWSKALEQLGQARRPGVPSVLVAHLLTVGGLESESERVFVGEGEQIPAEWLEGWDYVALGHLHETQQPGAHVWYSGSPLAYSFSEAGTADQPRPKGWLRVEWQGGEVNVTKLAVSPRHPMTRLEGRYDDFLTNPAWAKYADHYVELTLSDAALISQPLDRLRQVFPKVLSLRQRPAQGGLGESDLPRPSAAGSLADDALLFLADVFPDASPASKQLVQALAEEVLREAP